MTTDTTPFVPGVKIREVRLGGPPIVGVGTSTAGFVGVAPKTDRFVGVARLVTSADQFAADYIGDATLSTPLSRAALGFFANGGSACYVVNVDQAAADPISSGLALLEVIDEIAIIAAPGQTDAAAYKALTDQAARLGDRFAILDPPAKVAVDSLVAPLADGGARPAPSIYAAFYYPRIAVGRQLKDDLKQEFVTPVGHIAGVYARVDSARGVFKAPANEAIRGALDVEHRLADSDQNLLNPSGVNVLRVFSGNIVIWGARTAQASGDAGFDADYLYINVRRLVNYIEESLQDGLRWAVFEPNTLTLRKQITRSVRGFLDGVWRDGALFGATADEAYYVRFPELYNSDDDRAAGRLTVEIGLRVTFPAEFIVVRIGLLLQSASAT